MLHHRSEPVVFMDEDESILPSDEKIPLRLNTKEHMVRDFVLNNDDYEDFLEENPEYVPKVSSPE